MNFKTTIPTECVDKSLSIKRETSGNSDNEIENLTETATPSRKETNWCDGIA
jgi:hypothetical protein